VTYDLSIGAAELHNGDELKSNDFHEPYLPSMGSFNILTIPRKLIPSRNLKNILDWGEISEIASL
jgi:hypothetical protein